jgi:ABC-type branched-subunit amino acid transport system substrate-binding protein
MTNKGESMKHTQRSRSRRAVLACAGLVTVGMLAACTSGSDDVTADTTAATEETTAGTEAPADTEPADTVADTEPEGTEAPAGTDAPVDTEAPEDDVVDQSLTGDAPGVTDDTIKIGITYVDTEALKAVGLDYDLGPHQAVYEALVADINANGGINGRQLEAVFAPIDPTNAAGAEASCLKLTEDDDVFLVTGFFLNDAVMCPLEVHATAVMGGSITADLAPRALAPWAAWLASAEQAGTITQEFYDRGVLDGTLGVYMAAADEPDYVQNVKPVLDELGIEPVEVGIMDAPTDDTAAMESSVRLIAERFKAANVDTILMVGIGAPNYMQVMEDDTSFRPQLLFTETNAARAFYTSADTTDTSILEGALIGGGFGPDQARFDEPTFQECVEVLSANGVETPAPEGFDPDDAANQPYQAAFQACPDIWLAKAALTRAGANLNYGTLAAAVDGLVMTSPGDPTERTYGPAPDNGSPSAYIFRWDEATKNIILDEG